MKLALLEFVNKSKLVLIILILLTASFYFVPFVVLLLSIVGFILVFLRGILQLIGGSMSLFMPLKRKTIPKDAFVSIHVPAHNEPPDLLKNTLRALSKQDYSNYEVIVIDNNTKDRKIWEPVKKYCKELDPRFRFYHVEKLDGFKAGALNFIQDKVNPKTKYIAVVDADYEVVPSFIRNALEYFVNDKVALVQFPQAYKNIFSKNIGISMEYEYFFRVYMNLANFFHCATSTGTMAIYQIDALKKVKFFNKKCVTEDADIGVRLLQAGYETIYVPQVSGRGLMPFDIESYKKQKARWSLGNAQILTKQLFRIMFDTNLRWNQKIGIIAQLTAWINFILLPIILVSIWTLIELVYPVNTTLVLLTVNIASVTLYLFIILQFISFMLGFKKIYSFSNILRGFLVHLGLGWEYSTVYFKAFTRKDRAFERTNKFILNKMPDLLNNIGGEATLGFLSLTFGVLLLGYGDLFHAIVLFIIGTIYLLIFFVYLEIKDTKQLSSELVSEIERSFNAN